MGFKSTMGTVFKNFRNITKGYTETTTRPSVAQPYMSTDTGAKLPIFPFPLIMIYEFADNIDAYPINTIPRTKPISVAKFINYSLNFSFRMMTIDCL